MRLDRRWMPPNGRHAQRVRRTLTIQLEAARPLRGQSRLYTEGRTIIPTRPMTSPTEAQRLAVREWPADSPVMYQRWLDLLFLHWEYSPEEIQATLPEGLFVDTFGGKAYLGIVPFFMRNVRPRFLPGVPGLSHFMELNLRTYVHDRAGVPGVWFYSLDANQRLAVAIARRFFHLPYEHARMKAARVDGGGIRYESVRVGAGGGSVFQYAPGDPLPSSAVDSLTFFLIERYRLYAASGSRLWRGAVSHQPYALTEVILSVWDEQIIALSGLRVAGREPDHAVMSSGVEVSIFPLKRVC